MYNPDLDFMKFPVNEMVLGNISIVDYLRSQRKSTYRYSADAFYCLFTIKDNTIYQNHRGKKSLYFRICFDDSTVWHFISKCADIYSVLGKHLSKDPIQNLIDSSSFSHNPSFDATDMIDFIESINEYITVDGIREFCYGLKQAGL